MRTLAMALVGGAVLSCSATLSGDSIANLTVDPGSSATVRIRLEVDVVIVGSGNDTATRSVGVTGFADGTLEGEEPFTAIDIETLSLDLANTSFSYEFFCVPIFGCAVTGNLAVANFNLGIAETLSADIGGGGQVVFSEALFNPSFDFNAEISGVVDSTINDTFNDVAAQTFSCRVDAASGVALLDNFSIDTIVYDIDPATLPSGVNAVRIIADVDLGSVTMTGAYVPEEEPCVGDFDSNGAVDGGDLGQLLAAFGSVDAALDLDGVPGINGADIGSFLAAFGPCD